MIPNKILVGQVWRSRIAPEMRVRLTEVSPRTVEYEWWAYEDRSYEPRWVDIEDFLCDFDLDLDYLFYAKLNEL